MTPAGIATVARQEFRLRIRAGRWRLLLGLWFGVLVIFTTLLRLSISGTTDGKVVDAGVVVYGGLVLFVMGLLLLVVPALAAQSVNGDRERGTLATLQVSRLSAAEIALGKFAAAWGTALVFIALTLPMMLYAVTQGGVTVGRLLAGLLVLSLLLGTVVAVALAFSSLLARTTTSAVLSYLSVFALTLGTLIVFGLVTLTTTEQVTRTNSCPPGVADCPSNTFQTTQVRTDRTWFLLAANPFVVLADASPRLPPRTAAQERDRRARQDRGENVNDLRDADPLGAIGRGVRGLRDGPGPAVAATFDNSSTQHDKPVWPTGLAIDLALTAGALAITTRRLRTPTRNLPRGQRVA